VRGLGLEVVVYGFAAAVLEGVAVQAVAVPVLVGIREI
jgi:hypothetical protein